MGNELVYVSEDHLTRALLRRGENFGIVEVDLVSPPRRFWDDRGATPPTLLQIGVDLRRITALQSPSDLLNALPTGDNWMAMSRRSLQRLAAWFLICEDPQGRLRALEVSSLAHQTTLVHHLLAEPQLDRVLIADEVGLGKTVEAGLIISRLIANTPGLRVLYLAPARLVRNVRHELQRLELPFRQWVSGDDRDATLEDPRIVASIHRAVNSAHYNSFVQTAGWDVIIVDECHHLSAWEPNAGKPVRQYKLVQDLVARQKPTSRLILMSGTPHQGHRERFNNLLALLKRPDDKDQILAGRVIYRTKDDVRDWRGNPVFPPRRVNEPTIIDLGDQHRQWLRDIHDFYAQPVGTTSMNNRRRAAGWRVAQALQWASSSVNAGVGYLIRQALRTGWTIDHASLRNALSAIRPYRLGPSDEQIEALLARMKKEIERQADDADVDDIEEDEDQALAWEPDPQLLSNLLKDGVRLLQETADLKWQVIYDRILRESGSEKVVLFAQPIETVIALARFLEKKTGIRPALIIGDQPQPDRDKEIENFWKNTGPQFLVSSRAGGEGINLQIARRLVHVDVPWNPMELEQRVGRVHRFGSRSEIVVDTVVAKDSREVDMYRVARDRLRTIATALVPSDRFESLFARVMSLVPPEDFQSILGDAPLAPFSAEEESKISELVAQGFENWKEFHDRYNKEHLTDLDPGEANWDDIASFARTYLGAKPASGITALQFRWEGGRARDAQVETSAFTLDDDGVYVCGDFAGMPITDPSGRPVRIMGLNLPVIAAAIRAAAFPEENSGACHLRWPKDAELPKGITQKPFAVWIAARQTLRLESGSPEEIKSTLHAYALTDTGTSTTLSGPERSLVVRSLLASTIRRDPEPADALISALKKFEPDWVNDLRRPTDDDRANRLAHAVTPLLAAIVS